MMLLMLLFGLGSPIEGVAAMEQQLPQLMQTHKVPGLAVVALKQGEVVWSGYYGQRSETRPVAPDTLFNVGSMAKTVTTETVLRLVAMGRIDLDEPIADHYMHPDLKDDPRHRLLTPRLILSHQTGLLNWEYAYPDERLAFVADPGQRCQPRHPVL